MKTSKLLARAALPAGSALLSLSAWAVAASAVPVVAETIGDPPAAIAAPAVVAAETAAVATTVDAEPVLAPQVGNMKYSCRRDPVVAVVTSETSGAGPTQ